MDDHDDRLPGRQPHTVDQSASVDQEEIAELQRFLWSHTAPGRQSSARAGDGARPDNVRPLRPAERPERGAE